jgi:hypothetical protein
VGTIVAVAVDVEVGVGVAVGGSGVGVEVRVGEGVGVADGGKVFVICRSSVVAVGRTKTEVAWHASRTSKRGISQRGRIVFCIVLEESASK